MDANFKQKDSMNIIEDMMLTAREEMCIRDRRRTGAVEYPRYRYFAETKDICRTESIAANGRPHGSICCKPEARGRTTFRIAHQQIG